MKRIQFVVDDNVYNALEDLRRSTEARTLTEVFRNALKAYEWMVNEIVEGKEIRAIKPSDDEGKAFMPIVHRGS